MEHRLATIVVGGLLPALFYGLAGFLQKASARAGGTVSLYLMGFGFATMVMGAIYGLLVIEPRVTLRPLGLAAFAGALFAAGAGLISFALIRFDAPLSQLSPLYNMNILVSVLLGLFIFSELAEVSAIRLLIGTLLVLAGGWLVATA